MRKVEIENPEVMSIAIRQEIERSDESRYDHRFHGVLLVANGQSCREVALLFGEDPPRSKEFKAVREAHGLKHGRTQPYRPRTNGKRPSA